MVSAKRLLYERILSNHHQSSHHSVVFQHEYDHLYGRLIDKICIPGQVITQEEYLKRKSDGEKMVI